MAASRFAWVALATGIAVMACGGGDDRPAPGTPPPEGAAARPATQPAAGAAAAQPVAVAERGQTAAGGAQQPAAAAQAAAGEGTLVRETYSYRGSGRDPFISLLRSGDVRPLIEDLRVTSITYNPRYPGSSVAVLRELGGKRYTVRVGDELGRLRITDIRAYEVVAIVEEFGVERQTVLRLRRLQEGIP